MKITLTIVDMGGCYRKAIIGHTSSPFDGRIHPDAIYGATEEELVERIKTRLPGYRANLKKQNSKS